MRCTSAPPFPRLFPALFSPFNTVLIALTLVLLRYKGAVVRTAQYAADGGNVAVLSRGGQPSCPLQTYPMINPGVAGVGQGATCVFVPGTWSLAVGAVYRGGLDATYYNNQLLTVPYSSSVDTSWFFKDWGSFAPLGSLSRSDFGVRR